jgi:hypothetical protein
MKVLASRLSASTALSRDTNILASPLRADIDITFRISAPLRMTIFKAIFYHGMSGHLRGVELGLATEY